MSKPTVVLHLNGHCVKTAAQKEFIRLVDQYMALPPYGEDVDMAFRIEMLRQFLENSDFALLRSGDERLTGVREAWVRMSRDDDLTLEVSEKPFQQ